MRRRGESCSPAASGRVEPAADLDALAAALRERLLTESASESPGDVEGRIRALVEREAALLDAGTREALVARVAERSPISRPTRRR